MTEKSAVVTVRISKRDLEKIETLRSLNVPFEVEYSYIKVADAMPTVNASDVRSTISLANFIRSLS